MAELTLGMALGGGGARGVAHIGILEGLHERGIVLSEIAGSSAGAIIGAMYAASCDPEWMEAHFRTFLASSAFEALGTERLARRYEEPESASVFARRLQDHMVLNMSLHRRSLVPREVLYEALAFLVPARDFSDLQIPLKVCACDMSSCELVVHSSGDLIEALCDSAAIPGVMEPRLEGTRVIADGGIMSPIPIAQLESDFTIASDITRRGLPELDEVNIYRLLMRAENLAQVALAERLANDADFVFAADVQSLHWSQFSQFELLMEAGRVEARAHMHRLERAMESRMRWPRRLRRRLDRWLRSIEQKEKVLDAGSEVHPDELRESHPSSVVVAPKT